MKRIVVLGSGLVGATIARDLAADGRYLVTVADVSAHMLDRLKGVERLETVRQDLSSTQTLASLVSDCQVVVGALPSRFGYQTLKTVIEAQKPYCDISFMPEDALELSPLAREKGVCAVVDCGVAPGLANLTIGHSHASFEQTDSATIFVGGLPRARSWPFEYKAPFAPSDVLEEYTRPARIKRDGQVLVVDALSEPELVEVPGVGTLEAFYTDGLRSLLDTIDAPNLSEKTMRYPGHAEIMRVFRHTGLFSKEKVEVDGQLVSPLALTSTLLFERWALQPEDDEFTVLKVVVEGRKAGQGLRHVYDLFDQRDRDGGSSSMARSTGFPCAAVARWLAEGEFHQPGVLPPELLGAEDGLYQKMVDELALRGVELKLSQQSL